MSGTRTYAILKVSPETYREIRERLRMARYEHAFIERPGPHAGEVIDMNGIAIQEEADWEKRSRNTPWHAGCRTKCDPDCPAPG